MRSGRDRGFSIVSIMLSVSALEAFINESADMASMVPTAERQKIVEAYATVMSELEERKESLLVKLHLGLLVFSGSVWDEGSQPFQDFKLLLTTRNHIIHLRADRWESKMTPRGAERRTPDQYPKFTKALQQRGLAKAAKSESWLDLISTKGVATWACDTAARVTDAFVAAVPDGWYKESLKPRIFRRKGIR